MSASPQPTLNTADADRALLAAIVDSSGDVIISKNLDGTITSWNTAAERILGYKAEEIIGESISRVLPPDRLLEEEELLARVRHGVRMEDFESVRVSKEGRDIRFSLTISPILDGNGRIMGTATIARDISARSRSEEDLRESEQRYRSLYENSFDAVFTVDREGRFLAANPAGLKMCGYNPGELRGTNFARLIAPEDLLLATGAFTSSLHGEHSQAEISLIRKDGRRVTALISGAPIRVANEIVGVYGIAHDVSESRRAQAALQESEERFRRLVRSAPVGIFMTAPDGRTTYVNEAWCALSGIAAADAMENQWIRSVHPEDRECVLAGWDRAVAANTSSSAEYRMIRPGGSIVWIHGSAVPLHDEAGRPAGHMGTVVDITARKLAEESLRTLNEQLEQRITQRTSELRAAITGLRSEIAARRRLEEQLLDVSEHEQHRIGEDLHESLGSQLAGLAMLSQVQADKLRAEQHPRADAAADIANLVHESLEATRNMAKNFYPVEIQTGGLLTALQGLADRVARTLKIDCQLQCNERRPFVPDPDEAIHFYRIVQEAVTNAIKHSNGSRIRIKCEASAEFETVTVSDDGTSFVPSDTSNGMGWHLMRYRARLIGGLVSIGASPSGGCLVSCRRSIKSVEP